jgi:phosphopantetheinyl transferase
MNNKSGIYWRFERLDDFSEQDWSTAVSWLSVEELAELQATTDSRRQHAGLAGRYLARQLLREHVGGMTEDIHDLKILSRDEQYRRVPPRVVWRGQRLPCCLSISHTSLAVLVALCTTHRGRVGVDLVQQTPLSPGFSNAWLDEEEKELAETGDRWELQRVWAIKEAVYKTACSDTPFRPRSLRIRRCAKRGYVCVPMPDGQPLPCRINTWQIGGHVAALVTDSNVAYESVAADRHLNEFEDSSTVQKR